jgi:3-deoxy-D-manno-octulosonate 8-phosphate phosphatase (KDO 8-P phosphatase)
MINYDLKKIRAIVFDVDGVLSCSTIPMDNSGDPMRTVNIKDGYAIQLAQKMGLRIAIMTGGNTPAIEQRYSKLGVEDIYMKCAVKIKTWEEFLEKYGYDESEVMYVGDDIPDYEIMQRAGCACCPADACPDIKAISLYVSDKTGGNGCGRDVIEQVLRAQGKWLSSAKAFGW